jgi:hypothetical protein
MRWIEHAGLIEGFQSLIRPVVQLVGKADREVCHGVSTVLGLDAEEQVGSVRRKLGPEVWFKGGGASLKGDEKTKKERGRYESGRLCA